MSTPSPTTEPVQEIILTDRTTSEIDWECGMKRWWYKEEGGTGIVPTSEADYFEEGRQAHEDFARLLRGDSIDTVVGEIMADVDGCTDPIILEPAYRRAGWAAAYGLFFRDRDLETKRVKLIEQELILDRDPLWVQCTPDFVYQRVSDDRYVYREYKTVADPSWGWVHYWPKAIQIHIGLKAVEEEFGIKLAHGEVMGLVKGRNKDGRLQHPYVWAYWTENETWVPLGGGSGMKNLTPRPVWEYNGGIIEWVKKLGPEVANSQFPFSAPVMLDERMLADYIEARTRREKEVRLFRNSAQTNHALRVRHFEPRYNKCEPVIGRPCPYLAACHNQVVNADPLKSGLYKPRTPHHELEFLAQGDV